MKFLGLKIFIALLEVMAFLLLTPCFIVIGWMVFSDRHPLNEISLAQAAITLAAVGGVLVSGLLIGAFASLLNLMLAIERNTAEIAENTAPPRELLPPGNAEVKKSWVKTIFTPVRPSVS